MDGLIVSAAWIEAAPEALDAIKSAGVPVVLVDRMLKGGEFTSWIGPDNYAIGVGIGEYIVKRLNGKGRIVVLRGGPADNSIGLDRTNGMLSVVEKSGITGREGTRLRRLERRWRLQAHGGHADQVPGDRRGVLRERLHVPRRAEGRSRTPDGPTRSSSAPSTARRRTLKEIMADGTNYGATGQNNSDQIGRAGFNRLMAILAGAEAPKKTVLPSPIITKDNAVKFYNPDSVF